MFKPFMWSRPFDVHRWTDHQGSNAAVEVVFQEICALRKSNGRRVRGASHLKTHLRGLMLDLFLAASEHPVGCKWPQPRWVGISLGKGSYGGDATRYRKLFMSYGYTVTTLRDLIQLDYVKEKKGFHDGRTGTGYVTRIRATSKLLSLMRVNELSPKDIETGPTECIILRDSDGVDIDYEDTDDTNRWRQNLERINNGIKKSRIRLDMTDADLSELNRRMANDRDRAAIDYSQIQLKRIFNNSSFSEGGRFYGGWWQSVPREARMHIDINHKGTVEIDYSGLHIRMLYAMERLVPPDDPYDLGGFQREHQKQALMTMINAGGRLAAAGSVRQTLQGTGLSAADLLDRLADRHHAISKYFYSGVGIKLQFVDSKIAESVMLKMLDLGRVVLPMHDSFIMRASAEDELYNAMEEAFQEQFPGIPAKPKAKETYYQIVSKQRQQEDAKPEFVSDKEMWKEILEKTNFYEE